MSTLSECGSQESSGRDGGWALGSAAWKWQLDIFPLVSPKRSSHQMTDPEKQSYPIFVQRLSPGPYVASVRVRIDHLESFWSDWSNPCKFHVGECWGSGCGVPWSTVSQLQFILCFLHPGQISPNSYIRYIKYILFLKYQGKAGISGLVYNMGFYRFIPVYRGVQITRTQMSGDTRDVDGFHQDKSTTMQIPFYPLPLL